MGNINMRADPRLSSWWLSRYGIDASLAANVIEIWDQTNPNAGTSAATWSGVLGNHDLKQATAGNQPAVTTGPPDYRDFDGSDFMAAEDFSDGDQQYLPDVASYDLTAAGAACSVPGFSHADTETLSGTELVTNGTMEADSNWANFATPTTNERSAEQVYSGTYSRKFVADAAGDGIKSDTFSVTAGKTYRYTFWVYSSSTTIRATIADGDGSYILSGAGSNQTFTSNVWSKISVVAYASNTGAGAFVAPAGSGAGTFYIDAVSVQEITNSNLQQLSVAAGTTATHRIVAYDSASAPIFWAYIGEADAAAATGSELVTNGDMEAAVATFDPSDSTADCSYVQSAVQAHGGSNSAAVTRTTAGAGAFRKYWVDTNGSTVTAGVCYYIHAWVYLPSGQTLSQVNARFYDYDAAGFPASDLQQITTTDSWVEVGPYYVVAGSGGKLLFEFQGDNGDQNDVFYVDDLSIKPVTAFGTDAVHLYSDPDLSTRGVIDGSGDPNDLTSYAVYKNLGDDNLTSSFWLTMVVKPDDGIPAATKTMLSYGAVVPNRSLWLDLTDAGKIRYRSSNDGTDIRTWESDNALYIDGAQAQYSVVGINFSTGNVDIFFNGSEVASTGTVHTPYDRYFPLVIGAVENSANFYDGAIALVIIGSGTVTAAQMKRMYDAISTRMGL